MAPPCFKEVAESVYLLSQSVCLVPGDEYQLVIFDSVDDGMCCGNGERVRRALRNCGRLLRTDYVKQG
jgi:hypothetical protein